MNKIVSIIITLGLVIGIGIIVAGGPKDTVETELAESGKSVEVRDGIQYVTIEARGGYFPKVSDAKAGIPTKLILKTNGTYDCSASVVIRSIGYQKILPQTGEESIDVGIPETGASLQGTCSMGMYSFLVRFS